CVVLRWVGGADVVVDCAWVGPPALSHDLAVRGSPQCGLGGKSGSQGAAAEVAGAQACVVGAAFDQFCHGACGPGRSPQVSGAGVAGARGAVGAVGQGGVV